MVGPFGLPGGGEPGSHHGRQSGRVGGHNPLLASPGGWTVSSAATYDARSVASDVDGSPGSPLSGQGSPSLSGGAGPGYGGTQVGGGGSGISSTPARPGGSFPGPPASSSSSAASSSSAPPLTFTPSLWQGMSKDEIQTWARQVMGSSTSLAAQSVALLSGQEERVAARRGEERQSGGPPVAPPPPTFLPPLSTSAARAPPLSDKARRQAKGSGPPAPRMDLLLEGPSGVSRQEGAGRGGRRGENGPRLALGLPSLSPLPSMYDAEEAPLPPSHAWSPRGVGGPPDDARGGRVSGHPRAPALHILQAQAPRHSAGVALASSTTVAFSRRALVSAPTDVTLLQDEYEMEYEDDGARGGRAAAAEERLRSLLREGGLEDEGADG